MLAFETEDKKLDEILVLTALDFLIKNPKLSTYYLIMQNNDYVGTTMLSYGYDLIN